MRIFILATLILVAFTAPGAQEGTQDPTRQQIADWLRAAFTRDGRALVAGSVAPGQVVHYSLLDHRVDKPHMRYDPTPGDTSCVWDVSDDYDQIVFNLAAFDVAAVKVIALPNESVFSLTLPLAQASDKAVLHRSRKNRKHWSLPGEFTAVTFIFDSPDADLPERLHTAFRNAILSCGGKETKEVF